MDFVHPNRLDAFELAVGQAPVDKPRHRPIDAFPTGAKAPGRFPPGQPRPAGKEAHHGAGHRPLALTPGHLLDHHPVLRTLHPPGRIAKPSDDAPQRHEQPPALRQSIISRLPAGDTPSIGHGCLGAPPSGPRWTVCHGDGAAEFLHKRNPQNVEYGTKLS